MLGDNDQLSDLSREALDFYDRRLRRALEPAHIGRGIAVHPATGDYIIAANPTLAARAMLVKHPEGGAVSFRIGLPPEPALAGRVLGPRLKSA